MTPQDIAYASWTNAVHTLGGIATVWPFGGPDPITDPASGMVVGDSSSYGLPAARFPADVFATIAGNSYSDLGISIPVANGVQFNFAGTWVYVLASAMTGTNDVDNSAQAMTGATDAEAEKACAANNNCVPDWEKQLLGYAKVAVVIFGAYVAFRAFKAVA